MSGETKEEEDVCCICREPLPIDTTKFIRLTCCGKGIHLDCRRDIDGSRMNIEQKNSCPLCRTKFPKSKEEATDRIRRGVEKGKAWAQSMLGQKYFSGDGVEQSYKKAVELYELAALQGNIVSQYALGVMYYQGNVVEQSYEKAVEYLEPAAIQGFANAQYVLAVCYYRGQGVERSSDKAREWCTKAAEQGYAAAINDLRMMERKGISNIPTTITTEHPLQGGKTKKYNRRRKKTKKLNKQRKKRKRRGTRRKKRKKKKTKTRNKKTRKR